MQLVNYLHYFCLFYLRLLFLAAFAKLHKETLSFVVYVRPHGASGQIFMKIYI